MHRWIGERKPAQQATANIAVAERTKQMPRLVDNKHHAGAALSIFSNASRNSAVGPIRTPSQFFIRDSTRRAGVPTSIPWPEMAHSRRPSCSRGAPVRTALVIDAAWIIAEPSILSVFKCCSVFIEPCFKFRPRTSALAQLVGTSKTFDPISGLAGIPTSVVPAGYLLRHDCAHSNQPLHVDDRMVPEQTPSRYSVVVHARAATKRGSRCDVNKRSNMDVVVHRHAKVQYRVPPDACAGGYDGAGQITTPS